MSDLAFFLTEGGDEVTVISSRMRYDLPDAVLENRERYRGVEICRVFTTRFGRSWLPGRALDYLSFYLSATRALLCQARRGDVVVVKTDPPMLSVLIAPIALLRGCKMINWLQNLYPEVAGELGMAVAKGAIGRALARLRDGSLRTAGLNVVIGDDMAQRLRARGITPEKIAIMPNWADDESIRPIESAENALRAEWGLQGKFVVVYSGNLGRAHDVETLLGAAVRLKEHSDICFLFIGGGHGITQLREQVDALDLPNVFFRPYQPRENLSQSLCVGDVHWLSLKPGLDGLLLPSKFYGIAAAGRPVIVIGSLDGELSRLVENEHCGVAIAPGESQVLAATLSDLADNRAHCEAMGRRIRRLLDQRFSRARALERWATLLHLVAAGARYGVPRDASPRGTPRRFTSSGGAAPSPPTLAGYHIFGHFLPEGAFLYHSV